VSTIEKIQDGSVNEVTEVREQPHRPGPEHKRLQVFVGKWHMEGQQYDGPFGPAAKVTAVKTYEWLTGGFFVVHRLDGRLGDHEMACIEIIGQDASSQSYVTHTFYNDGNTKVWQVREVGGTWTSTADWQKADESLNVRCTTVFTDAGQTMTAHWEYSSDGSNWQPFMDVKATKV
jgi:hypothetical protein